jgi:hypothetical protein
MAELLRSLGLPVALTVSLTVIAMGLAAVVETDDPDWALLVIGVVLLVVTVPPLLLSRSRRNDGA